jgi:hypothetical protein
MTNEIPSRGRSTASAKPFFFQGQVAHLIVVIALVILVYFALSLPGCTEGAWLGLSTTGWMLCTIVNAILHQTYVWFCWRLELQNKMLTRWFGERAFVIYAAPFFLFLTLRMVLAFVLGWSNRGTIGISPQLGGAVSILFLLPVVYLMVSVHRFFGFTRAAGVDHFKQEFRSAGLVRKGIFRWSPNAMYLFGFLALWIPGFLFQSAASLVAAGFSHAYIWAHYFCTEKPDMRRIYG